MVMMARETEIRSEGIEIGEARGRVEGRVEGCAEAQQEAAQKTAKEFGVSLERAREILSAQ